MQTDLEKLVGEELRRAISQMADDARANKKIPLSRYCHSLKQQVLANHEKEDVKELLRSIELYLSHLGTSPEIWANLFLEEKIHSKSKDVELGQYMFAYKAQLDKRGKDIPNYKELNSLASKEVNEFLKAIGSQLVKCFGQSKQILVKKVSQLNTWAQKADYANKYIIFKVLKEMSHECNENIRTIFMDGILRRIDPNIMERLVKFVIQKHQLINITMDLPTEDWVMERGVQSNEEFEEDLVKYLQELKAQGKKFMHSPAQRQDGKKALMVVVENGKDYPEKYLLMGSDFGTFAIMNCVFITKKWNSEVNQADFDNVSCKNIDLDKLLKEKEQLVSQMRNAPTFVANNLNEGIHNVGGSLGKCLANFKEYDSVQSFVTDFSKKTALSGSISYMVFKMPLLGSFMIVGGFSYTLYKIAYNDFKDKRNKFKDAGKIALKMSAHVGGSVVGAAIGQALIPVPLLGLFIGGAIGSLVASFGTKKIMNYVKDKKFAKISRSISSLIQPDGSWKYNKELLRALGVNQLYFQNSIPKRIKEQPNSKDIWGSAICFFVLSYFESQKDNEVMAQQAKNAKPETEQSVVEDLQKLNQPVDDSKFISSDLQRSIQYLEHECFPIRQNIPALTDFMVKTLEQ